MVLALKDTADFPIPTKNIVDNDNNFNYTTAGSINAYDRTYLDIINANRTKFFPYGKVLIERSTDSGSTWTTVSTSDFSNENRGNLMSDVGTSLYIGVGNAALTQQLRVTLQFPGTAYYCSLDRAFFRFSNSGHACSVTIEASTYGAQSTYTTLASNQTIAGWSGNNMVKFSERSAWGTNNSNHLYNVRFTFKYTSINSSYPTNQGSVQKIDMFGQNFWGTSNSPQHYGHLYSWDYLKNVTFPANVTASAFLGNATSSTYLLGNGRIASADISHIYTGNKVHQRLDIVSSTLTTGRPAGDGYLTTYMWDNAGTYDAQFYMPNGATTNGGRPQVRYRPDGGSWSAWASLAKLSDVPTVNDATLTIQKNGTTVDTFTANASSNVTANITVPESFSDLTGTIGTSQIDNSAVTDTKIDWSTMCTTTDYSGTNSGNSWSMKEFKYADGTMELWGSISFGSLTTHTIDTCTITYPTAFIEAPIVVVGLVTGSSAWTLGNFSAAYIPNWDKTYAAFRCYNGSTENRDGAATFTIRGRWK